MISCLSTNYSILYICYNINVQLHKMGRASRTNGIDKAKWRPTFQTAFQSNHQPWRRCRKGVSVTWRCLPKRTGCGMRELCRLCRQLWLLVSISTSSIDSFSLSLSLSRSNEQVFPFMSEFSHKQQFSQRFSTRSFEVLLNVVKSVPALKSQVCVSLCESNNKKKKEI